MNLHNAKIDRRPCFHIFNALLFDTTPRSARATYQTDGSLRHHWNFTTPATPGLRSGTESRLRRSIMIGRTGHGGAPLLLGRLTDRILCRMRFCARRAANVSDMLAMRFSRCGWLSARQSPLWKRTLTERHDQKPAGRSAERDALLSIRAGELGY